MMDKDNKLIEQFFAENKHEIEDNGFSKRVIHALPKRQNHSADVLNVITIAACIILFFLADGWSILWGNLQGFIISTLRIGIPEIEPITLIGTVVVLLFLFYHKVLSTE